MIKIKNLSRTWDDFKISDLSLNINKGEYFVILGPTGAGKTLLLELLAGFYKPENGEMIIDGKDYTDLSPNKRGFAFVYQDYMLFPHMDVKENIAYGLKMRDSKNIEEKVKEVAEKVDVSHLLDRNPITLSGGEKQRVSLARAIALEPDILLLDEPFGSLDYKTAEELRNLIKELHNKFEGTFIHVTHNQEEAVTLGDRVAVMKKGKIEQVGRPEDIMRKPHSRFIAEFVGTGNIFHGNASISEDITKIDVQDKEIFSTAPIGGEVVVTIRPEDIIISNESFESSARNNFKGEIKNITDRGNFHEIKIDVGLPIIVYVTKQSIERLGMEIGKKIHLMFKASAVHLFKE
ncbi:MAG: tungstate ABC transporter ATP-binding protein WtpC [Thermoplasmatota archaeon]